MRTNNMFFYFMITFATTPLILVLIHEYTEIKDIADVTGALISIAALSISYLAYSHAKLALRLDKKIELVTLLDELVFNIGEENNGDYSFPHEEYVVKHLHQTYREIHRLSYYLNDENLRLVQKLTGEAFNYFFQHLDKINRYKSLDREIHLSQKRELLRVLQNGYIVVTNLSEKTRLALNNHPLESL